MVSVSSDKEKLNQLLSRVDALLITINKASEELRAIQTAIKNLTGAQETQPTPKPTAQTQPPAAQTGTRQRSIDDIRMSFPEELEAKLDFADKSDYITIKPKMFLGSDNFAKIASAVRGMGGEYISAGKDSHFRVPKTKA
jgi:hypothetical protein